MCWSVQLLSYDQTPIKTVLCVCAGVSFFSCHLSLPVLTVWLSWDEPAGHTWMDPKPHCPTQVSPFPPPSPVHGVCPGFSEGHANCVLCDFPPTVARLSRGCSAHLGRIMETMCCSQVGLGLVRCSANPQPPARGLQTILFPFLLPEPFWLWVAIPWVCLWSLWVRCRVAEVGTLPLCSWTWPELVTRTLTGSWVLGARGTQALLGPEGSRLSPCGHHMCTLLLPSHLPLPGADHAAGAAKGLF